MTSARPEPPVWVFDASVFINLVSIANTELLIRLRSPSCVPHYVFREELVGPRAHAPTRAAAEEGAANGSFELRNLTLQDLAHIASLGTTRKASLGEVACAILAEREGGGLLIDDHKARTWLASRVQVSTWEGVEEILIDAAHRLLLTEYDLDAYEEELKTNRYHCRCRLRHEYLMQRLAQRAMQDPAS